MLLNCQTEDSIFDSQGACRTDVRKSLIFKICQHPVYSIFWAHFLLVMVIIQIRSILKLKCTQFQHSHNRTIIIYRIGEIYVSFS